MESQASTSDLTSGPRPLSPTETDAYLRRIGITASQLEPLSKNEALREVHVAHLLHIPFDTTSVQLPANWWTGPPETPVVVQPNGCSVTPAELVSVDADESFERVIKQRRGGYCFNLNSLFARLLVSLGFRLRSLGARVNLRRGENPNRVGCEWTPITHLALLVETEPGVEFLCDVGFGGGASAYPIKLIHGIEIDSLTDGERFRVRREVCPYLKLDGALEGWTMERWVKNWWSPCYHAYLTPLTSSDIEVYNWYNSTCPRANFRSFMAVSLLRADGSRRSLVASAPTTSTNSPADGGNLSADVSNQTLDHSSQIIKLHTKSNVAATEVDQCIIPANYGALYQALVREFGWGPAEP